MTCKEKKPYDTFFQAFKASGTLMARLGEDMGVYECPECKKFHLFTKYKQQQKIKSKILERRQKQLERKEAQKEKKSIVATIPPWKKAILRFVIKLLRVK